MWPKPPKYERILSEIRWRIGKQRDFLCIRLPLAAENDGSGHQRSETQPRCFWSIFMVSVILISIQMTLVKWVAVYPSQWNVYDCASASACICAQLGWVQFLGQNMQNATRTTKQMTRTRCTRDPSHCFMKEKRSFNLASRFHVKSLTSKFGCSTNSREILLTIVHRESGDQT